MDLSQQELPLTAHFAAPNRNNKSTGSASRPSKRKRTSVASPLNNTARQSKLQPTPLQLPTPATSTRKCRRLEESRAEVQLGTSRLRQLQPEIAEDAVLKLPSPPRQSDWVVTPPQASPRSESVHDADGHLRFSCRMFSRPSRPPYQDPPCSSIGSASSDPFYTHQDVRVVAPEDSVSLPSEALNGQRSDGPVLPMLPVPSSQSQYLLHPDATPKLKRFYQRVEYVVSSQLQEEEELTLTRLPKDTSSMVVSPGKRGLHQDAMHFVDNIPRYIPTGYRGGGERRSQRFPMLEFTPVAMSTNSSAGPSCSFVTTNNASDKLSLEFSISPKRKGSTSHCSPSCNSKAIGGVTRQDSIEGIPPVYSGDSLTESESDSNMLRLKIEDKLLNSYSPRGSSRCKLPSTEADSATEAESDTEIRHCVEQIRKNHRSEHRLGGLKGNTPPPTIISPLVSPAKSRIAVVSPTDGFPQSPTRKGAGSRIQGPSYPSALEHRVQSQSLPSVVREFIRMFPGDESYPADFPESLRI